MGVHFVLGVLHFVNGFLDFLKICVDILIFFGVEGLLGSARMYPNSGIAILIDLAHIMRNMCVLQVTSRNQEMITSNTSCSFDDLMPVIFMMFLAKVVSCKLMVSQVSSNVIETVIIVFVVIGFKVELLLWLSFRLCLPFLGLLSLFGLFVWFLRIHPLCVMLTCAY